MYMKIRSKLLHNCTKAVISYAKINQNVKRKEIKSFLFKFVYVNAKSILHTLMHSYACIIGKIRFVE